MLLSNFRNYVVLKQIISFKINIQCMGSNTCSGTRNKKLVLGEY